MVESLAGVARLLHINTDDRRLSLGVWKATIAYKGKR